MLLSAIIPTIGRPELARAVRSVLSQRDADVEAIVVCDGSANVKAAREALGDLVDAPSMRFVVNERGGRASAARNFGVTCASGDLVGFLDDDDEWLPDKANAVLAIGSDLRDAEWLLAHAYREEHPNRASITLPSRRPPENSRAVADYLVARPRLRYGSGALQTSTLVCPRELAVRHPWAAQLPRHQDWDWVITLVAAGTRLHFAPQVLGVLHSGQASVSRNRADAAGSLPFLERAAGQLGGRAATDFLLTELLRRSPVSEWRSVLHQWSTTGARKGVPHMAALALAGAAAAKRISGR